MNGLLYPKTASGDAMRGDEYGDISMKPDEAARAKGGGTSELSGPTTSSRSYPKGAKRTVGQMNPQKVPATKIYVGGVD